MKQPQEQRDLSLTIAHIQELCAQLKSSIAIEEQPDITNLLQEITLKNYPDHWEAKDLKKCIKFFEIVPILLEHCNKLN